MFRDFLQKSRPIFAAHPRTSQYASIPPPPSEYPQAHSSAPYIFDVYHRLRFMCFMIDSATLALCARIKICQMIFYPQCPQKWALCDLCRSSVRDNSLCLSGLSEFHSVTITFQKYESTFGLFSKMASQSGILNSTHLPFLHCYTVG